MRDSGADFPVVRRRDAQLRQRQRRPRTIGLPVTRRRGRKRRQRQEIVTYVERAVSLDEIDGGADGRTDAAALDHHIMFEPTDQPDARRFLNDDQPQAPPDWRARSFDVGRRRVIVCMGPTGGLHAYRSATSLTRRESPQAPLPQRLTTFIDKSTVGFHDERITRSIDLVAIFERARALQRARSATRGCSEGPFIAAEKVVGLLLGRMEFGPRALRESFRPFAPAVLRERVHEWFELDGDSPYMLLVADVRPSHRLPQPAGVDALWGIEKTGCPVIVNTSFNVRGEPIVCTPEDAYRCFMRTNMDVLVLESFILEKAEQAPIAEDQSWREEFVLD